MEMCVSVSICSSIYNLFDIFYIIYYIIFYIILYYILYILCLEKAHYMVLKYNASFKGTLMQI